MLVPFKYYQGSVIAEISVTDTAFDASGTNSLQFIQQQINANMNTAAFAKYKVTSVIINLPAPPPQPQIQPTISAVDDTPLVENNPDQCPTDFAIISVNSCITFAKTLSARYGSEVQYQATWSAQRSCRYHSLRCDVRHPTIGNSFEVQSFDFSGMCKAAGSKSSLLVFHYRWVLPRGKVFNTQGSVTVPEGVSTEALSLLDDKGSTLYAAVYTITYKESSLGTFVWLHVRDTDGQRTSQVHIASSKLMSSCASEMNAPQVGNSGENSKSVSLNINVSLLAAVLGAGVLVVLIAVFCGWRMVKQARERRGYDPDFMERERQRHMEEMRPQQPVMGIPVSPEAMVQPTAALDSDERSPAPLLSPGDPPPKMME